ncbi:oligosaccharide flippase family protein [Vibrio sp. WJH972]
MKIKKELNKAILSSLLGKYFLYIFQIVSLAILSRLFTPEMFGVVAAFQVFILFFQLIANSGLAPAVVYKGTLTTEERNGIFSATLLIGIVCSIVFLFATPYLVVWLGLEYVEVLSWVLAINVLFSALSMLPMASLQKDAKFMILARAEVYAELISLGITLILFYFGYGVEALASKLLFVPVFRFVFYYLQSADTEIGRASFGRNVSAISSLYAFAKFQVLFNVLNYFSRNLDTLLITKYFGVATVGFYEKSYQVMRYPLQLFTFAITPALQPVLTKYKDQPDVIEKEYYPIAFKLAMLGIFVSSVLFWGSEEIVFIMFGSQWAEAGVYLAIFSVSIPLQMVLSSTGGIYQAVGASKLQFYCGVFSSIVNVAMIISGVLLTDLVLLCKLLVAGYVINFIQCFWLMHKRIFKSLSRTNLLLIFVLILVSYLNLLFFNATTLVKDGLVYLDAFIYLCVLSGMSLVFTGVCYVLLQKFYWK